MENEKAKLLDHEYDGIKELDNPLPGWWLATFYGTILFAVFYYGYYQFGNGKSLQEELVADRLEIEQIRKSSKQPTGPTSEMLAAALANPEAKAKGKGIFAEKCLSCHGANGEGGIGPNLTDNYWIHGDGKIEGIAATVSEGVLDKGMPPWKALLKEDELVAVVAYVYTLNGTNPPNAKAPQGTLFPR